MYPLVSTERSQNDRCHVKPYLASEENMRTLKPSEIDVKVKQVNKNGCLLLLYKTARVDMAILDEEYPMRWQSDYKTINGVLYCGIGIQNEKGEWLWRWDCGVESRENDGMEKKGEASDAFKRAGFKWGIGRELYTAPFIWAKVPTVQAGAGWQLADRYAKFSVETIGYDAQGNINSLVITDNDGKVVYKGYKA